MRFKQYLVEYIDDKEAQVFIDKWKSKLKTYGLTQMEMTTHFLRDRLNHRRNKPPISIEEIVLTHLATFAAIESLHQGTSINIGAVNFWHEVGTETITT